MKKIAIFSAARSDFGILKNLIINLEKNKKFDLNLIINSAHISSKFGETVNEIKEINIKKKIYLKFKYKASNPKNIINYFNNITKGISKFIEKKKPEAFIIMGDRYEMLACAFSCLQYQIPIIHLCGGSITLGSLDNIYRDNISKMANLHLVESKFHKMRLNEIGIKKNIHIVGAPALENLELVKKNSLSTIINNFKLKIDKNKKIIIACFHPETNISLSDNTYNLKKFLFFLKKRSENIIFTYPNADSGFNEYIKLIKLNLIKKKNCSIVKNLGIRNYYSLLQKSHVLIGNSSSGIIESASFKIPVINIGNRQKNRFYNENVIHSNFNINQLNEAFDIINSKDFKNKLKKLKNFYYQKKCSKKSIDLIYKLLS